jgi:hypothetical protein
MKQYETMANESYIDVTTLINTVRELALSDLGLNNETTPYIIDENLAYLQDGTTKHGLGGYIQYVGINMNQSINKMIETIFHESRHIWQIRTYKRYMDRLTQKKFDGKGPKTFFQYWIQPVEIGARLYAKHAMKKYAKQIDKIIYDYAHGQLEEKLF